MVSGYLIAILMAFLGAPAGADPPEGLSGEWVASFLGHRLVACVQQRGEVIEGVAYLHKPLGGVDTYHFTGIHRHGKVAASHHEGHTFEGELVSPGQVRGVLVTRDGERLEIGAKRR